MTQRGHCDLMWPVIGGKTHSRLLSYLSSTSCFTFYNTFFWKEALPYSYNRTVPQIVSDEGSGSESNDFINDNNYLSLQHVHISN